MNRPDFHRIGRARIRTTPDTKLATAAVDNPTTTLGLSVLATSAMAEEVDARSASRQAALLLATAQDVDLDRRIAELYHGRLTRKAASAASISLDIVRAAPGATSGFLDAGTEMLAGGFTWELESPGVGFGVGEVGPKSSSWRCQTAGTVGNISAFLSTFAFARPELLFDATLALGPNNAATDDASGGAERELDSAFRARAALFDRGLDENIVLLEAGALAVEGVEYAVAIEEEIAGQLTGRVSLYVADVNGRAGASLLARVRASLRGYRMAGQNVVLYGAAPDVRAIVLSFAVLSTADASQVQANARSAVVAYVNALAPGAPLLLAGLKAALSTVVGLSFSAAYPYGVVTPSTDITPASTATVFRTTPAAVTFA